MELSLFPALLASGLSWTLSFTPVDRTNPNFFRTCLLVVLGLSVLAVLTGWASNSMGVTLGLSSGVVLAYCGATAWYLDRRRLGTITVHMLSLILLAQIVIRAIDTGGDFLAVPIAAEVTSAALLGSAMGAMLLGHQFLIAPWMSLAPLQRLIGFIGGSAVVRSATAMLETDRVLVSLSGNVFLVIARWLFGIVAPVLLSTLAYRTLRYKNTQAATGILYVATICVFIGEAAAIVLGRTIGEQP
jgi:hypothetical protein